MVKEWLKEIPNWEKEYLTMDVQLSKRQREILEGDELKSNEGMLFCGMYSDWKRRKGYDINNTQIVTSDEDVP